VRHSGGCDRQGRHDHTRICETRRDRDRCWHDKVTDAAEFQRLFAGNAKREETFRTKGSTLVGDVHPEVAEVAEALTPVPGGVGPLTIAMLIYNTVKAAKLRRGSHVPELSKA